ncbi:MAG: hypothetical protein KIT08_01205 [Anaerolineales bacterium]|nr:MAG: hypothetical protein KIT08_01205 [Anaerolineales bacterium]
MFEIRPTTNAYAIYKDGQRFSDSFYLTASQAKFAKEDLERAWLAGCDHGEQVRAIQTIVRRGTGGFSKPTLVSEHATCMYHSIPLMNDGRCSICMSQPMKERV